METSLLQEIQEQTVDAASQFDFALFDFSGDTEAVEAIFEDKVTLPPKVAVGDDNPDATTFPPRQSRRHIGDTGDWGKFESAKPSDNAPQSEPTTLSDDDCILVAVGKIKRADSEGPESRREKRMKKKKTTRVWKGNGIVHEYHVGEGKAIVQLPCRYCAMGIIHSASKHKGRLMSVMAKSSWTTSAKHATPDPSTQVTH